MKNCDPRVKLLAIMLLTSLCILYTDILWMSGVALVSILFCVTFGADYKLLWNKLKRFVTLLIGVCILQIIFVRTGEPIFEINGFVLVFSDGLLRGGTMALRFFVLISSAAIMAGENSRKVIASLSKMKLPYTFSFMIMITLRFIPFFSESFSDALTSLQLRGIELEKVRFTKKVKLYGHLLFPVVADAIIKSQDLSMAMEARGFRAMRRRTSYIDVRLNVRDITVMLFTVAFAGLSLYYYYSRG